MKRRQKLVESLLQRKAEHDWQGCCEILFRVLYGIPANAQLSLARFAIGRYLAIFEHKWPTIKWPAELLRNVNKWLAGHGRSLPEEPADPDPADSAFLFAFDALLLASQHQSDELIITSSCAAAVISAINARQCNVWIADDPEGVVMWKGQGYFPGRSVSESRPGIGVAEREWEEVATWLRTEEVGTYSETITPDEIETGLARWKDQEMLLVVPGNDQPHGR